MTQMRADPSRNGITVKRQIACHESRLVVQKIERVREQLVGGVHALTIAIADRNGNRQDRETGLGPKDESDGSRSEIAQRKVA